MQLTPEQLNQVRQAQASNENRAFVSFTPEQRRDWRETVDQELSSKSENVAHIQKLKAAAAQPGFFGDIRRAILLSGRPIGDLAAKIGVEPLTLSSFCAAEAELPATVLDRLVSTLGLRLMQEIPR